MWGKLEDGRLVVAPRMIRNIANPHDETYLADGWKRVDDSCTDGMSIVGWKTDGERIVAVCAKVEEEEV